MTGAEILLAGLTILAILAGPFLGVRVQKWLEDLRSRTDRRKEIFQVLMATRLARLSPEHVHALNRIDLEFRGTEAVQAAWRDYLGHLNYPRPTEELSPPELASWLARGDELFTNLLYAMSNGLGYGFDRPYLSSTAYRPRAFGVEEQLQQAVRMGAAQLLAGKLALPIRVVESPPDKAHEGEE